MKTFETFRPLKDYDIRQYTLNEPSVFNNIVRVKRYKITIEEIDESNDVIQGRLQGLYDNTTNWHQKSSIRDYCSDNGYDLDTGY